MCDTLEAEESKLFPPQIQKYSMWHFCYFLHVLRACSISVSRSIFKGRLLTKWIPTNLHYEHNRTTSLLPCHTSWHQIPVIDLLAGPGRLPDCHILAAALTMWPCLAAVSNVVSNCKIHSCHQKQDWQHEMFVLDGESVATMVDRKNISHLSIHFGKFDIFSMRRSFEMSY